jgi:transposase InsO family protein
MRNPGLSEPATVLSITIRKTTWLPLDEIHDLVSNQMSNEKISRSAIYRTWQRNKINTVPKPEKEKAKTFKEYEPGYLHIDVTYLPKFNGQPAYLYVAIDRATRLLFYKIYSNKTAEATDDFCKGCLSFFPFVITHILTDNGLEFTNRLIKSKTGSLCQKPSLLDQKCKENNIQHRLTLPGTPKTNGMVERANGIIKNDTILKKRYNSLKDMQTDLCNNLINYNLYRRHGSLVKELQVRTPIKAVEKWMNLKPEIFKISIEEFKNKILSLNQENSNFWVQPCET